MSNPKTILLVEDEILVARSLERRLRSIGFKTVTSSSGEGALKEVQKSLPDLILMDVRLEGTLDGVDTAQVIAKDHIIPIIFLTAFSDEQLISRINQCNSAGYFTKPFSETVLIDLINRIFSTPIHS